MDEHSARYSIEAYDFDFELVVAKNVRRSRNKPSRVKEWREFVDDDFIGLWTYSGRRGILFLERKYVSHSLIAHEVRHAVDYILHKNQIRVDWTECRETPALVTEYITSLVYRNLKKWKIRVK